jgi:hypothetical protein
VCYHPAVFFHHLVLLKEKFGARFKNVTSFFLVFENCVKSEIAQDGERLFCVIE